MKAFNNILNGESGISVRGKLNDILSALVSGSEGVNALWSKIRSLIQYINAMDGGVGGFVKSTDFDPSELDPYKAIVLISLKTGTFTNLKDINGDSIVVSASNPVTVFYRAPESSYWDYDTQSINPLLDIESPADYEALDEAIEGILEKNGDPYYPITKFSAVYRDDGSGDTLSDVIDNIETEVFPLTVAIASSNAGTREIGTSVTPNIVLGITRKGSDVSSSAQTTSSQGTVQSDHKTITGSALTSGTTTFQISVSQGGQTKSAPNQVFDFMNYRYYGVINSSTEPTKAQVKTLCENGTLTKQLSRSTKMGATDLAANKCFVFVVPNTSVNLIVKNAKSGNPISGCTVDTVTINRVNGSDTVSCKYVIVPSGAAAWTFEITN